MLNKEQIIEVCKKSSFTAATFGYSVMVVPEDEFSAIAEQILSLLKSNSDTPPQLNKHDVMRWLEIEKQKPNDFQVIMYKTKDGRVGEGEYRGNDWVKVGDEAFPFAWWVPQPTIA